MFDFSLTRTNVASDPNQFLMGIDTEVVQRKASLFKVYQLMDQD